MCDYYNSKVKRLYDRICDEIGEFYEIVFFEWNFRSEDPDLERFLNDPASYSKTEGVSFGERSTIIKRLNCKLKGVPTEAELGLINEVKEAYAHYLNYEASLIK